MEEFIVFMVESSQTRILGIVGSPRRGGNTEILIDEILTGAEESGALIEKVILNEMNIKPCQACNSCYKTGKCSQDDDMLPLFKKMENARVWVLGTPIYWWGPTAQFKAFLDRWYNPKHKTFKGKRAILVIPLGGKEGKYSRHTVGMLTDVLNYLNMEIFETLIASGVNRHGAVREKSDYIKKAKDIGKAAMNF